MIIIYKKKLDENIPLKEGTMFEGDTLYWIYYICSKIMHMLKNNDSAGICESKSGKKKSFPYYS